MIKLREHSPTRLDTPQNEQESCGLKHTSEMKTMTMTKNVLVMSTMTINADDERDDFST